MIGTWRYENQDGIEEISLHSDHSFWFLNSSKTELVIPSPFEVTGSWQLKGNQLLLDSVVTWSKERSLVTKTLVRISTTSLITKNFDGTKDLKYTRLEEPGLRSAFFECESGS